MSFRDWDGFREVLSTLSRDMAYPIKDALKEAYDAGIIDGLTDAAEYVRSRGDDIRDESAVTLANEILDLEPDA